MRGRELRQKRLVCKAPPRISNHFAHLKGTAHLLQVLDSPFVGPLQSLADRRPGRWTLPVSNASTKGIDGNFHYMDTTAHATEDTDYYMHSPCLCGPLPFALGASLLISTRENGGETSA